MYIYETRCVKERLLPQDTKTKILIARSNVFIEVHFLFRSHFLKD